MNVVQKSVSCQPKIEESQAHPLDRLASPLSKSPVQPVNSVVSQSTDSAMPMREWYMLCDASSALPVLVRHCPRAHPSRTTLEAFISTVYFSAHKASLNAFMPDLFAIYDHQKQPAAAVGLRRIRSAPIFLEQYLDAPIETLIRDMTDQSVVRERIAEVGNLGAISAGAGRQLIAFLVYHLSGSGVDWAVCTGTNAVRASLCRMGVAFEFIVEADPERLGEDQHNWGSYYQNNPIVIAVDIRKAAAALSDHYDYAAGAR